MTRTLLLGLIEMIKIFFKNSIFLKTSIVLCAIFFYCATFTSCKEKDKANAQEEVRIVKIGETVFDYSNATTIRFDGVFFVNKIVCGEAIYTNGENGFLVMQAYTTAKVDDFSEEQIKISSSCWRKLTYRKDIFDKLNKNISEKYDICLVYACGASLIDQEESVFSDESIILSIKNFKAKGESKMSVSTEFHFCYHDIRHKESL